jgi:hypothetical protein
LIKTQEVDHRKVTNKACSAAPVCGENLRDIRHLQNKKG